MANLSEISPGRQARVVALSDHAPDRRRLTELGIRPGALVSVVRRAPLGGPLVVKVGGGLLAMRIANANAVTVEPVVTDG